MPMNFPTAPTNGQEFTAPNGRTYVWDGATWLFKAGAGTVAVGGAPPTTPQDNTLWWSSTTGVLSIRYNDGSSTQWVGINDALAAAVTISDAPPTTAFPGMLWWESDTGELAIRYNDGDSEQWVSAFGGAATRDVYSTTEVLTNKVWIDSKPIYRKAVNIGALPNAAGSKSVAHGLTGTYKIVSLSGIGWDASGNVFPIPYVYVVAPTTYAIQLYADATNVVLTVGIDRSSISGYVILEYTKG